MNKDQSKGTLKQAEGLVKEATGKLIGDKDLETEGKIEHAVGKIQKNYGDLKEDIKKNLEK